jgi:hypothetical protein
MSWSNLFSGSSFPVILKPARMTIWAIVRRSPWLHDTLFHIFCDIHVPIYFSNRFERNSLHFLTHVVLNGAI